jgi:hypothetical protein
MTPEELKLLGTLSVYVEALASCVAPDVLQNAINAVNTKRAALAQARAEVAAQQAPVVPPVQQEAPATALVSVPADLGSTTTGPKRRGKR